MYGGARLNPAPERIGQTRRRPGKRAPSRSSCTRPFAFPRFVVVGELFAAAEWINLTHWGYHVGSVILFGAWGIQFLIWGVLLWLMWRFCRT